MDLNHVRRFAVTRDGLFSALWVWCSCWIVLNLDTFLVGWETISMVNKALYNIPFFSPQAAPPAGPLISRGGGVWDSRSERTRCARSGSACRGGASEARAAIGLAALAVVWLRRTLIESY